MKRLAPAILAVLVLCGRAGADERVFDGYFSKTRALPAGADLARISGDYACREKDGSALEGLGVASIPEPGAPETYSYKWVMDSGKQFSFVLSRIEGGDYLLQVNLDGDRMFVLTYLRLSEGAFDVLGLRDERDNASVTALYAKHGVKVSPPETGNELPVEGESAGQLGFLRERPRADLPLSLHCERVAPRTKGGG